MQILEEVDPPKTELTQYAEMDLPQNNLLHTEAPTAGNGAKAVGAAHSQDRIPAEFQDPIQVVDNSSINANGPIDGCPKKVNKHQTNPIGSKKDMAPHENLTFSNFKSNMNSSLVNTAKKRTSGKIKMAGGPTDSGLSKYTAKNS